MSSLTRCSARRSASAPWVAALLLFAELLAFVHAGCAEHRFCPEHGVVEHVLERARPTDACGDIHHDAHGSRDPGLHATPDEQSDEAHVACIVLAKRVETGANADPTFTAAAPARAEALTVTASERVPSRPRRYLLAPKHSPPAA